MNYDDQVLSDVVFTLAEKINRDLIYNNDYCQSFFEEIDEVLHDIIDKKVSDYSTNENEDLIKSYHYDVFDAIELYKDKYESIDDLMNDKDSFYAKLSYVVLLNEIQKNDYIEDVIERVMEQVQEEVEEDVEEEVLIKFHSHGG